MYDLIIIGAGPAGMTAGIYAARKKLKTLIVSKDIGGQMAWSNDIENYTGFSVISGADLTQFFKEHLLEQKEDLELKEGVEIISLEKNITTFEVQDRTGAFFYSKAVIVASGRRSKKLHIPGEDEFWGKGVSVCATCDAPLYKNKTVAVVGGGNSAMDALYSLSKVAKTIYSINIGSELAGDEVLKTKVAAVPNIVFLNNHTLAGIEGDAIVRSVKVTDAAGAARNITVDGVFVEIGFEPNSEFDHISQKTQNGEIKVDRNLQTNVSGLFAAGDVNDAWGEQIIIAAGEGAKAAMAAADFLARGR